MIGPSRTARGRPDPGGELVLARQAAEILEDPGGAQEDAVVVRLRFAPLGPRSGARPVGLVNLFGLFEQDGRRRSDLVRVPGYVIRAFELWRSQKRGQILCFEALPDEPGSAHHGDRVAGFEGLEAEVFEVRLDELAPGGAAQRGDLEAQVADALLVPLAQRRFPGLRFGDPEVGGEQPVEGGFEAAGEGGEEGVGPGLVVALVEMGTGESAEAFGDLRSFRLEGGEHVEARSGAVGDFFRQFG